MDDKICARLDELFDSLTSNQIKKGKWVALTGAGISEESGIPTFRGENGLWSRYDPEVFASPDGLLAVFRKEPFRIVDFLDDLYSTLFKARPNAAHISLAELEKRKILNCVITQNIDNLHQEGGSRKVLELHGNAFNLRCISCIKRRGLDNNQLSLIIEQLRKSRTRQSVLRAFSGFFPRCACGGRFRIDIVLFGELLPRGVLEDAYRELEGCSWLLLVGTSGSVFPAASLPAYAKNLGVKIVEINNAPSYLSAFADFQFQGRATEILPELVRRM